MSNNKKDVKALILSGGGVKGAFQYGALDYIYNHVLKRDENFKIICGVSAGAMNGAMVAQNKFERGKEIWDEQIESNVTLFNFRFSRLTLILYCILPGIALYKKLKNTDFLFKNEGLREKIAGECKELVKNLKENDTYLRLGVVNYQTGKYISVDPTDTKNNEEAVDIIMASTSIPLAFPGVLMFPPGQKDKKKKYQYFDGGVINITPFKDIFDITRQPDFQKEYNLTHIYSVLCSPLSTRETEQYYNNLFDIAARTLDISGNEIYKNDLELFNRANAYVLFRNELEKKLSDKKKELDEIYEIIHGKAKFNIKKYSTASNIVIAPEPAKWIDFLKSDEYNPKKLLTWKNGNSSDELFWKQFPTTLTKTPKRLRAAYDFGRFMANEILGSKR